MKKFLLPVLFILLILPSLSAEETPFYDEWVHSSESFTIGEDVYYVYYFPEMSSITLKVNEKSYVIRQENCEKDLYNNYCYMANVTDPNDETYGQYVKFEKGRRYAGLNLQFFKIEPDLTIERDFELTTFEPTQESKVTVILTNEGNAIARNIVYEDHFPKGNFSIVTTNVQKLKNGIRWEGRIAPGAIKTFTYTIRADEYTSYSSTPLLNYTYEELDIETEGSSTTLDVPQPYLITTTITPTNPAINELIEYEIEIENKDEDDDLDYDLLLTFPSAAVRTTVPKGFTRDKNTYRKTGTLEEEEKTSYLFKLKTPAVGSYVIKAATIINVDNKVLEDYENTSYTVGNSLITPIIILPDVDIRSGRNYYLSLSLKNEDTSTTYYKLKGTMTSDAFDTISISEPDLAPGKIVLIYEDDLIALDVDERTSYEIEVNGTYETKYSDAFEFYGQSSISFEPVEDTFSITRTLDKDIAQPGENLTISVSVTNLKDDQAEIEVIDSYPDRLPLLGGNTHVIEVLESDESFEAYSYKLKIPEDYDQEAFVIQTVLHYKEKSYVQRLDSNITVNITLPETEETNQTETLLDLFEEEPEEEQEENLTETPQEEENITETPPNIEEEPQTEEQPEEETPEPKGFIGKLTHEIKGFFSFLFG